MIHELLHVDMFDVRVVDPTTGLREKAYGDPLTRALAVEDPDKARRNPDNYEHFCLAVWDRTRAARQAALEWYLQSIGVPVPSS